MKRVRLSVDADCEAKLFKCSPKRKLEIDRERRQRIIQASEEAENGSGIVELHEDDVYDYSEPTWRRIA
jgi:hypothetical protein